LAAVTDDALDPQLPGGTALRAFATALLAGRGVAPARGALVDAVGPARCARAAAVAADFEMMNRLVDATGCPVPAGMRQMAGALGLELSQ
jgi:hypothetical protein